MPSLDEVSYSRDETVAAIRDYYQFLVKMFLDEASVIEPPEGGWPEITADALRGMGKTDTVIELLRRLPYIAFPSDGDSPIQGGPHAAFADWRHNAALAASSGDAGEDFRSVSEGARRTAHVPAGVVGLTCGGRENRMLLLDTDIGVVYWPDCPDRWGAGFEPSQERFEDDPYDWVDSEREAMWREEGGAWAVADFFEVWKDQFRTLQFVPIPGAKIREAYTTYHPDHDGVLDLLRGVYREHGWPDLDSYRKEDCMRAVRLALREKYPDMVGVSEEEGV